MTTLVSPATAPRAPARKLLRVLGAAFALAIVVGATIGGGILRTPGDIAAQLPRTWVFLAIFAFGGFNALLGATAYAELGAMIPRSGGIYTFARRAMGDSVGFVVGLVDWINYAISTAAVILLIGEYMGAFVPVAVGHQTLTGFIVFGAIVGLQWQGVAWSGRFQELTTVLKTAALFGLVIAVFVLPHAAVPAAATAHPFPHGAALLTALALSMQGIIFTFDSYYQVVYCSEEIHDPGREIPRSIFRGLALVITIFMLLVTAFLVVVPLDRMAGDPFVGGTVARAIFGEWGDSIIRAIVIVSVIGAANALTMAGPRVLHAMSEDGLFPRQATTVNAGGTPSGATLLTALLIAAFLFAGSFNAAIAIDSFIIIGGYTAVFISLFVLRRREPNTLRPYRAWGYPWVAGLALLIALVLLGTLVWADPKSGLMALVLVIAIWPASFLVRRYIRPE